MDEVCHSVLHQYELYNALHLWGKYSVSLNNTVNKQI